MIDKICDKLMKRIRAKMPEVDDERAEVIKYGLEVLIGEIPKAFILLGIAGILGIFRYTLISFFIVSIYRTFSGGIHLKSHISCIIGTFVLYCGTVILSKYIIFQSITIKILVSVIIYIYSITVIILYAPADTENIPILIKKDRKRKKIISFIIATLMLYLTFLIEERVISNICIWGMLLQSLSISKGAYKLFKVKFGYLEYIKNEKNAQKRFL